MNTSNARITEGESNTITIPVVNLTTERSGGVGLSLTQTVYQGVKYEEEETDTRAT